jgi:hypothetical protein
MPALVAGIHVFLQRLKTWMAGTTPLAINIVWTITKQRGMGWGFEEGKLTVAEPTGP